MEEKNGKKAKLNPRTKMFLDFFRGRGVTFVDIETGKEIQIDDGGSEEDSEEE